MVKLSLKSRDFTRGVKKLLEQFDSSHVARAGEVATEAILAESQRKAPFRFGQLRNSANSERRRLTTPGAFLRFGFTVKYAAVMDQGWKVRRIVPKRAKGLFIPLTRRAARMGPRKRTAAVTASQRTPLRRRGPQARASRKKTTGKDFIIVPSVKPPKARYGRKKGPNRYFSGTLQRKTKDGTMLRTMGRVLERGLR